MDDLVNSVTVDRAFGKAVTAHVACVDPVESAKSFDVELFSYALDRGE